MTTYFFAWGEITLRALASIITLFFLAKLVGPRQIAQLTFYDYVIGISVGSIAAAIAVDADLPLVMGLWAMFLYIAVSLFMAWSGNKSMKLRRFFSGTPAILFAKGKIIEKNLAKQNLDLNDLLGACRTNGYFHLEELAYIILEVNGSLSFLPKREDAPLTPQDMQLSPQPTHLSANVIIDGNIMEQHLTAIGKDTPWLNAQLKKAGYDSPHQLLLATATEAGDFYCYAKGKQEVKGNLFD